MISRSKYIEELKLREEIKRAIKVVKSRRKDKVDTRLIQERKLRSLIRSILVEETDSEAPHASTGINVLADLLKKIVPVIEVDYKQLTTDPTQRESYRAHIVNAMQNAIAPAKAAKSAGEGGDIPGMDEPLSMEEVALDEVEIELAVDDEALAAGGDSEGEDADGAFIDISGGEGEEGDEFGIDGEDQTGRNFAQATFDKIEQQIIDAYSLLANEEDQNLFYDYLLTNAKLYFDKFEDELSQTLPEPTTPEYEEEKDDMEAGDEEGEEAEVEGGEEDLGGDEELEDLGL